jgi:hypothetical protein
MNEEMGKGEGLKGKGKDECFHPLPFPLSLSRPFHPSALIPHPFVTLS